MSETDTERANLPPTDAMFAYHVKALAARSRGDLRRYYQYKMKSESERRKAERQRESDTPEARITSLRGSRYE